MLLGFLAEHRLALESQLQRVIGTSEDELGKRLDALWGGGYLTLGRLFAERHCQIRSSGLAAIDCALPAPRWNPSHYKHDVGVAWLWLAAHGGTFGPLSEVVGERRMRSRDGALERSLDPYGVRLGGFDRYGNERLHYPDLLLIDRHGRQLALELELTSKGKGRRDAILEGYAADSRIDRVLYLVEDNRRGRGIGRGVGAAADRIGLSALIRVQLIRQFLPVWDGMDPGAHRGASARRARAPGREAREEARGARSPASQATEAQR